MLTPNFKQIMDPLQPSVKASDQESFRRVSLNCNPNEKFVSNQVKTARYSIITWIPKSIIIQFLRLNNIYYLGLTIAAFFPFSPKNGFALAAILIAMLFFQMIKDGVEDVWRHVQDRQVNRAKCMKFDQDQKAFKVVHSEDLKVGDIIKIEEHGSVPADCILLASSEAKGVAYLNTMNLDGETALKDKMINHLTAGLNEERLNTDKFDFFVEQPNKSLISWNANIKGEVVLPLSMKQLLLRGCILKNTEWVIGIIVYTGVECKIVLNSKPAKAKISSIQRQFNRIVVSLIIFLLILVLILGGVGKGWYEDNEDAEEYIDLPSSYGGGEVIVSAITYWLVFFSVIPITIFIAIEIMRLIFCSFIKNDMEMYNEATDRGANWRASDNVEQMGQVEFIFSDKTGTLTKNEMEFMNCTIEGKDFDIKDTKSFQELTQIIKNTSDPQHESIKQYFSLLTLCNSVFPSLHEGKTVYHSTSPDDIALINAAKLLDYELLERNDDHLVVRFDGFQQVWRILAEIPFSSERKKMSMILQDPSGQAVLLTKGADSVILPKLDNVSNIEDVLNKYAHKGLRTLVMANRKLTEKKYQKWISKYNALMLSNSHTKDQELDELAVKIEKKMKLLGVSAIEDKLQDGVPEAIELLISANIRVWMITGDKEETAVEIGKSCNLVMEESKLLEFYHHNKESLAEAIKSAANEYQVAHINIKNLHTLKKLTKLSLAFNGIALTFIIEDKELSELFFKLAYISDTCICSRMSPLQKSEIVHLFKKYGSWTTLAIGDGANDVAMIQEAHVGIGVAGKEGAQACLAAEFTLTQFSHLTRLLLVHGRYSYFRLTGFIYYFFYKNFLLSSAEMWFAIYCGISGQIFYLDWYPPYYDIFWTSWPCMLFFCTDQDVSPSNSLKFPNLYSLGQKNANFGLLGFWRNILFSFIAGTIIFWISVGSLAKGSGPDGHEPGLFYISAVCFMLLVHTVNLKLVLTSRYLNKVNLFALFLAFFIYYILMLMLNAQKVAFRFQPELADLFVQVLRSGKTWVIVIIGSFIAMIPDFLFQVIKSIYFPSPTNKVMNYLKRSEKVSSSSEMSEKPFLENNT